MDYNATDNEQPKEELKEIEPTKPAQIVTPIVIPDWGPAGFRSWEEYAQEVIRVRTKFLPIDTEEVLTGIHSCFVEFNSYMHQKFQGQTLEKYKYKVVVGIWEVEFNTQIGVIRTIKQGNNFEAIIYFWPHDSWPALDIRGNLFNIFLKWFLKWVEVNWGVVEPETTFNKTTLEIKALWAHKAIEKGKPGRPGIEHEKNPETGKIEELVSSEPKIPNPIEQQQKKSNKTKPKRVRTRTITTVYKINRINQYKRLAVENPEDTLKQLADKMEPQISERRMRETFKEQGETWPPSRLVYSAVKMPNADKTPLE